MARTRPEIWLLLFLMCGPDTQARAEEIKTKLQDWAQLPKIWQNQLRDQLIEKGALDKGDEVTYDGPTGTSLIVESNAPIPPPPTGTGQSNTDPTEALIWNLLQDFCWRLVDDKYELKNKNYCESPGGKVASKDKECIGTPEHAERRKICDKP